MVVDNASDDGSIEGVEDAFSNVDVVRLPENIGFAAANNLAIERLTSRWIALLNPDAFPEPGWLEALVRAAEDHPQFTFFASRLVSEQDPSLLDGTGDLYYTNGLAVRRDHRRPNDRSGGPPAEVFSPCAAAALYDRNAFRAAGGFDESYFCYFEDVDLAFRMRLAGHRCLYVPNAVVRHVGSASSGRRSDFTLYHGHRNLVWTYFKDMPLPLLVRYLPEHVLLNVVSLAYFTWSGHGRTIWRAKRDALLGLPRVLRQRRAVQSRRHIDSLSLRKAMVTGLLLPYRHRLGERA